MRGLSAQFVQGTGWVIDTLLPTPQLAAAILAQLSLPPAEVANAIEAFRKNHLQELQVCLSQIHPHHPTPDSSSARALTSHAALERAPAPCSR